MLSTMAAILAPITVAQLPSALSYDGTSSLPPLLSLATIPTAASLSTLMPIDTPFGQSIRPPSPSVPSADLSAALDPYFDPTIITSHGDVCGTYLPKYITHRQGRYCLGDLASYALLLGARPPLSSLLAHGRHQPHIPDVYAHVCSTRQCWASKCRGL
jgi:hypothetical protein